MVDDELGVREGCRKILCAEGFDVVTAGDGKAGLEQFLERGPFGVLLVDLQMPRMSGLELMRDVRSRDEDVVCIIITAHATIDTAVEGTRQGAYSFIPKPFTADELLLSIKNGLERRALCPGGKAPEGGAGAAPPGAGSRAIQEQHDHLLHDRRDPRDQYGEAGRFAKRCRGPDPPGLRAPADPVPPRGDPEPGCPGDPAAHHRSARAGYMILSREIALGRKPTW